jgi:hypothetical protein
MGKRLPPALRAWLRGGNTMTREGWACPIPTSQARLVSASMLCLKMLFARV